MPSRSSQRFFTLLLAVSGALVVVLVRPLADVLLFAAVIAAAVFPVQVWLAKRLRGHRTVSAILIVVAFTLTILVPLSFVGATILRDAVDAMTALSRTLQARGIEGLTAQMPEMIRTRLDSFFHPSPEQQERINQQLLALASGSVRVIGKVLSSAGAALVATGLSLIAVAVFLIDGPALMKWIEDVTPLERGQVREILSEFKSVTSSVLVGNVATSGVQALVAFVGYLIARMPKPVVATVVTFVASFIPGIGGAATVVVASGVLFLTGARWRALFLLVWAIAAVGVVDNVVKPYFVKRGGLSLNGAVVFFSLLAGIAAFGPVGVLTGPLVMALFVTLVRIYRRDYAPSPPAEPVGPPGRSPPISETPVAPAGIGPAP